jgi:hypothetical protein
MTGFYFLVSSLPELVKEKAPQTRRLRLPFRDFITLCNDNLSKKDSEKLRVLLLLADIENIRSLYLESPWDPSGSCDRLGLEAIIQDKVGFPDYVVSFLEEHDTSEARIKHFPRLLSEYYRNEGSMASGFLKEHLSFSRQYRLVIAAIRYKKRGRHVEEELRYESPHDTLVAQILAQKDADTYEPPDEFEDLKRIFSDHFKDPVSLSLELIKFQWDYIVEKTLNDPFTLDFVLGYCVLLGLQEKAFSIDQKLSQEILEGILKG